MIAARNPNADPDATKSALVGSSPILSWEYRASLWVATIAGAGTSMCATNSITSGATQIKARTDQIMTQTRNIFRSVFTFERKFASRPGATAMSSRSALRRRNRAYSRYRERRLTVLATILILRLSKPFAQTREFYYHVHAPMRDNGRR